MQPKVALVVITDGRGEYLEPTIRSLHENLKGNVVSRTIIDDSGEPTYADWINLSFPTFERVHHAERRGLAGAVRSAWTTALESDANFIWHHEEDFTLNEPVDLSAMAEVLDKQPHLAQLVLKRQPWSPEEIAAGGQMEVSPNEYVECDGWVEHQRLFSFNPCLVPTDLAVLCLNDSRDGLERGFTDTLLAAGLNFAYWGKRDDPPRCHHIGLRRSAGYRW